MVASPMLSVVIPTYRKPRLLERTLRALQAQLASERQPVGCPVEIVVVDDGSGDDTPELLRSLRSSLPLVEPGSGVNEGRARARNRGWRAGRGSWVLFLDDDIVLAPGALSAHARAQTARRAAWLGDVVSAPEIVDSTLFEYLDSRGSAKRLPGAPVPARYFLTQNVSLPRDALEAVGGFDEGFGAYGFEDMELAFRLQEQAGLSFYRLDGPGGEHIHHHSLELYLQKKELCGRASLPRLAEIHPSRLAEMRLDLLPGLPAPASISHKLLRAALAFSFRSGGPALTRALLRRWPAPLARGLRHRAYDYAVLSAYAHGLRQRSMPV